MNNLAAVAAAAGCGKENRRPQHHHRSRAVDDSVEKMTASGPIAPHTFTSSLASGGGRPQPRLREIQSEDVQSGKGEMGGGSGRMILGGGCGGAMASLSPSIDDGGGGLGGVRLSYFDEGNVMMGAAGDEAENDNSDDDDDDDCTEASGDTVIHEDDELPPPPPPDASREEINRYYWELCYGPVGEREVHFGVTTTGQGNNYQSVMRSAPAKSCLSTKKKDDASKISDGGDNGNDNNNNGTSMTPRRILHHSPNSDSGDNALPTMNEVLKDMPTMMEVLNAHKLSTPDEGDESLFDDDCDNDDADEETTPLNNMTQLGPTATQLIERRLERSRSAGHSAVKFGNNVAALYSVEDPSTVMTPMPQSEVVMKFPSEMKVETESDAREYGVSRETARNVATLAEWEDDFDSLADGSDDSDDDDDYGELFGGGASTTIEEGRLPRKKRGRKHRRTPYKKRSASSHGGLRRPRKSRRDGRRDSSIFSRERKSLINEMDETGDGGASGGVDAGGGRGSSGSSSGDGEVSVGVGYAPGSVTDDELNSSSDTLLPLSVTIDPGEYTSPSSASASDLSAVSSSHGASSIAPLMDVANEDDEGVGAANSRAAHRGSLDARGSSACISPGGLMSVDVPRANNAPVASDGASANDARHNRAPRESSDTAVSSITMGGGSSDSDATAGGAISGNNLPTPNSARTSSSTILRAVHASGALLPEGHSPPMTSTAQLQLQHRQQQQSHQHQGGGGGEGGGATTNGGNNGGAHGGLLRPNQLKYSPSSSSSGGSSASNATRTDVSPSDSSSLGSDIMSLFTQHSLFDEDSDVNGVSVPLSQQLFILSNHATHPFATTIRDLMHWIRGSDHPDLTAFLREQILKGLSPSTSLLLALDQTEDGNDCNVSLRSFLSSVDTINVGCVRARFESILLEEIEGISGKRNRSSSRLTQTSCAVADADTETMSDSIKSFHNVASNDWSSLESEAAARTLSRLREMADMIKATANDDKTFVVSCCKKLMDTTNMVMQQMVQSKVMESSMNMNKINYRKRKVLSQIEETSAEIQALEAQLATNEEHLRQTKRAKQTFDSHLEMERSSPISVLLGEILASIVPIPKTVNGSEFTFSLLDGSAEVVAKISLPDEDEDSRMSISPIELGCFIKNGGASTKLLQAILLGSLDANVDKSMGPFPLRESLGRMIHENDSQEETFLQMTHSFSRIDALVQSVRDFETGGFCTVNGNANGDVVVSVSTHCKGTVVQLGFVFRNMLGKDWQVTTVPSNVTVSIASGGQNLRNQLQGRAQMILFESSSCDPVLLRRICENVVENFAHAAIS